MAVLKKNDFVEVEYTGKIKSSDKIFDLTDETLAKKEGLYDKNFPYGPKILCVGQKFVIKGLDDSLEGKKESSSYTVEIKTKDAFGQKNPQMVQVVPMAELLKQKIRPFVGLKLTAGGMTGNVRSVTGGRVTIDFNHPLAGRDLVYEVKLGKLVKDSKKKLESLLFYGLGLSKQYTLKLEGKKAKLKIETDIPDVVLDNFKKKVKEVIPEIDLEI